jgi:hypothetical protein
MAITINWATRVINVPKADLALIQLTPTEIRELNIDNFRLTLKDIEDDTDGIVYPTTHNHVAPISVGGVTLARVVELINNYTVTFEDGGYAVNIVGGNSNIGDRVNVNQVSVRSANSAGLVQSREIEYASFDDGVTIDVVNGVVGTLYPTGTSVQPVNNMDDALLIAGVRGLSKIFVRGSLTLDTGDVLNSFTFVGESATETFITINPDAVVSNCRFLETTVGGTLDGGSTINACIVSNLYYVDGHIHESVLGPGTIQIAPGASPVVFLDCWASGDSIAPVVDLGGIGPEVAFRNYGGDITLINKTGGGNVTVDINVGGVVLDSTISGGIVTLRGIGSIVDNSTGGTINSAELISGSQFSSLPELLLDLPNGVETNLTVREAMRLFAAVLAGRVSGAGTGTERFRDTNNTKDRVTSTVDTNGNRTNVTTDLT